MKTTRRKNPGRATPRRISTRSADTGRRIAETAIGAALGAAIAGPAGAVAAGLAASHAASRIGWLGGPKQANTARDNPKVRRILVPIDFSAPSLDAARFGREWAARFHAQVYLLHVIEPFGTDPGMLPPSFRNKLTTGLEKFARKQFSRSTKVSVHVGEGIAHDQIVASAQKLKADLIIIATHGRSGLVRALVGGTAERVVHHAPCPVLVVRPRERHT